MAERGIRMATGLVIILGLLGTFYGLTLSVGRLVHLIGSDSVQAGDVADTISAGLSHALIGMAVAFSNSLLGIVSAALLSIVGIFSNVTDCRVALMVQVETLLDRMLPRLAITRERAPLDHVVAQFSASVAQLESTVQRIEAALRALSSGTKDFREFTLRVIAPNPTDPTNHR